MAKVCSSYKMLDDGFCVNYIGDKEHKSGCKSSKNCKIYKKSKEQIKSEQLKKRQNAQITGLTVPYETQE